MIYNTTIQSIFILFTVMLNIRIATMIMLFFLIEALSANSIDRERRQIPDLPIGGLTSAVPGAGNLLGPVAGLASGGLDPSKFTDFFSNFFKKP
ncbi:hypothetical protein RR46_02294 [Papilio xuthus]|uniref:Uncharacterized protein n=1 Tax=Papilio xuthus TaxID=66420 RepID=A0A194QJR5_PAPXU|nr:hypothetical protein RR46_02294 [Papilio xuthus]